MVGGCNKGGMGKYGSRWGQKGHSIMGFGAFFYCLLTKCFLLGLDLFLFDFFSRGTLSLKNMEDPSGGNLFGGAFLGCVGATKLRGELKGLGTNLKHFGQTHQR